VATLTDQKGRGFNVIAVGGTTCNTSTLTSTIIICRLVNSSYLHSFLLKGATGEPVRLDTSGQTSGVVGAAAAYDASSNRLVVYGGMTDRGYLERFQELTPACNPGFGLVNISESFRPCQQCAIDEYWAGFDQTCLQCPAGLQRKSQARFAIQDCIKCLPK
jgi:hypothetical protein